MTLLTGEETRRGLTAIAEMHQLAPDGSIFMVGFGLLLPDRLYLSAGELPVRWPNLGVT